MNAKDALKLMRDDAYTLAIVTAIDEAPITEHVFGAVANWFDDVEIIYPIAVMDISETEKRNLANAIATEMTKFFEVALQKAEANEFSKEDFELLGLEVDPLWRELTGVFAKELNDQFTASQQDDQNPIESIGKLIEMIAGTYGEEGVEDFKNKAKTDKHFRAQLRRMGLNPDNL